LVATFAQAAGPTIAWLKTFGVRFGFLPTYFITSCQPRMAPIGGGLALIEALAAFAENKGARFFYQTTARNLVQDEDGAVVGVRAVGPGNRALMLSAGAVVLASGGYQGNAEMLTHYIGPRARYIRPVARGGYYDKGEGIRMALAIGAAPCGDFGRFHAEPLDPRSGAPEPIVLVFNYGILVNRDGRRFVDEAPATVDATYEAITRLVLEQPDGIAYAILDSAIDDVPGWRRSVRSDQPPIKADSIAELAGKLGLNGDELARTVAAYNAACPLAGTFDPLVLDGLATESGLIPRKSNWSRPLTQPPFLAYPIICGNCFTFGGLKVNSNSQVLNADGEPIPGLYAAGETIGLYYGTYTGATSVLRGAVFGRIAGQHAGIRL
jgi:tricarballylate dehydrogenase